VTREEKVKFPLKHFSSEQSREEGELSSLEAKAQRWPHQCKHWLPPAFQPPPSSPSAHRCRPPGSLPSCHNTKQTHQNTASPVSPCWKALWAGEAPAKQKTLFYTKQN